MLVNTVYSYFFMVEIFVFALLALYLSVRLWNVLGTNSDIEGASHIDDENLDNVVIMPKPEHENAIVIDVEAKDLQFSKEVKAVKKLDKKFNLESFGRGASKAFTLIVTAYASGDKLKLKKLLTPAVYKSFVEAIKSRDQQNLTAFAEVKNVDNEIKSLVVGKNIASISIRFSSDQCVYTTDDQDQIIDNKTKITNRMVDDWTFTRDFSKDSKIWMLADTQSIAV